MDEAYRRYKGFLCGKWEDELPNVDFEVIRERTSLSFDEESQQAIRRLLGAYERDLQVWETIPAKEVAKRLKAIVKACDALLPILEAGNAGFVTDALEAPAELAVWYKTSPKVLDVLRPACRRCSHFPSVDDEKVADFLSEWRDNAKSLLPKKGTGGHPTNYPLRDFLIGLHSIYRQNGGEGLGCYRDRASSEYRGSFLELAQILLVYTSENVATSTLGDYITKNKVLLVQK